MLFFIKAFFHGNHFTYFLGDYIITYAFCTVSSISFNVVIVVGSLSSSPHVRVCVQWMDVETNNVSAASDFKENVSAMRFARCVLHNPFKMCTYWRAMEINDWVEWERRFWMNNSMWRGSHAGRLRLISVVLRYMCQTLAWAGLRLWLLLSFGWYVLALFRFMRHSCSSHRKW